MRRNYQIPWALVLGLVVIEASGPAQADWFGNAEARLLHDSNLTNGKFSDDIVSDSAFEISASAGNFIQLNNRDSLSIFGAFEAEDYKTYDGMDNLSLGINLVLKRKWALGLYAPWTSISASAARLEFKDDVRDGWLYQAQIGIGKRITERWDVWAEVALEKRTADENRVIDPGVSGSAFDQINRAFKVYGVYVFNEQSFMTLCYQIRSGDVVSTAREEHSGSNFDSVMTAVTADPVFGPDAEAYRLHGTTQTFGARLNKSLPNNFLLGIEYQRHITHAKGNNNYYKIVPAITLTYSF
jgi:hypothetical protein